LKKEIKHTDVKRKTKMESSGLFISAHESVDVMHTDGVKNALKRVFGDDTFSKWEKAKRKNTIKVIKTIYENDDLPKQERKKTESIVMRGGKYRFLEIVRRGGVRSKLYYLNSKKESVDDADPSKISSITDANYIELIPLGKKESNEAYPAFAVRLTGKLAGGNVKREFFWFYTVSKSGEMRFRGEVTYDFNEDTTSYCIMSEDEQVFVVVSIVKVPGNQESSLQVRLSFVDTVSGKLFYDMLDISEVVSVSGAEISSEVHFVRKDKEIVVFLTNGENFTITRDG